MSEDQATRDQEEAPAVEPSDNTPKTDDSDALPPVPPAPTSATPPSDVASAAAELGDDDIPFTTGEWAGMPQYKCKYCDEAFVEDEMAAWLHYRDWHQFRTQDGRVVRERRALLMSEVDLMQTRVNEARR